MNNSLPYSVVYSSGSQQCKKCETNIDAGCVQIAIMLQSNVNDCHYPEWFHIKCFFQTRLPKTKAAFDGFTRLRYADQIELKMHLGTINDDVRSTFKETKRTNFSIEYVRKDGDNCNGCRGTIMRPGIRIMNVVYDLNKLTATDGKAVWYHITCFAQARTKLGWLQSAESLPGFRRLAEEDKAFVLVRIPLISRELYKPVANVPNPKQTKLDKLIQAQNKEYYEIYDNLVKFVSLEDRALLLRINLQFVPETEYDILHQLTDVLYFGAFSPCKFCNENGFIFANSTYVCCTLGDWSKCGNDINEPERHNVYIPCDLRTKYPFLTKGLMTRTRVLQSFRTHDENGQDLVYGPYQRPKLFNMEFVIVGNLEKSQQEIEKSIVEMGGTVAHFIHEKTTAVISNVVEVEKNGLQMMDAAKYNIQVVSLEFLTGIQTMDPIRYIAEKSICDWGSNPLNRVEQFDLESEKDDDFYTKSVTQSVTLTCKNGCAVDPDSGMEKTTHVFCQAKGDRILKYSVVLGLVDIETNKNGFYRMQLLKMNDQDKYYLFESWGRTSTSIGSKRVINYDVCLNGAILQFHQIYKENTGNNFGSDQFKKFPKKYYQLEIEFGPTKSLLHNVPSKLNPSVHQLMLMLFDVNEMEKQMFTCDLDLKRMPLGKLSAAQIRSAMQILKNISSLISQDGTLGQLREASNKFYTLIPHGFGIKRPTIIDSLQVVQVKSEMLESLLNMDLIYSYFDEKSGKNDTLDTYYLKMKSEITPVSTNSMEFNLFRKLVADTHGSTHDMYTLELLEAFKIKRSGEDVRFKAYDDLPNHMLLWHGSRNTNFVSILTNGLQITPPEVPVTGHMFGKGIYFADVISKAANYCRTDKDNNIGLMLLCEVALGDSQKLCVANENIKGIPNNRVQSVKGRGIIRPEKFDVLGGVLVASGELTRRELSTVLFYNEYVVYDPAQVIIKYLVKVKFNYKT